MKCLLENVKSYLISRSIMVLSEQSDLTLFKEIVAERVLTKKEKARERGSEWQTVA